MGREPVVVNGAAVTSPQELATGDKIEVLLENRSRVFYFQGDDETVQIRMPARQPLANANTPLAAVAQGGKPATKGPAQPPPPPPPPPPGAFRAGRPAVAAAAPAPAPMLPRAPAAQLAAVLSAMPADLQAAIKVWRFLLSLCGTCRQT